MNTQKQHKWQDVIMAWANGESIQYRDTRNSIGWEDYSFYKEKVPQFNDPMIEWRIKPRVILIKYRIALMKGNNFGFADYYTETLCLVKTDSKEVTPNNKGERWISGNLSPEGPNFIKWITPWQFHEISLED